MLPRRQPRSKPIATIDRAAPPGLGGRGSGHILAEADDVTVEIADLELLHAVNPQYRRPDDIGPVLLKLTIERIDVITHM